MRKLFLLSLAVVLLVSCKKEEEKTIPEIIPPVEVPNYFPMEIGSYWVYENYRIDSSGVETELPEIDSIVITKDTMINNHSFFVFEGISLPYSNWKTFNLLRDSAGYIIDESGKKFFSAQSLGDTLRTDVLLNYDADTTFAYYRCMLDGEYLVNVPVGEFVTLKIEESYYFFNQNNGSEPYVVDDVCSNYADGIGKVFYNWGYASAPWIGEKRLLRYHIPVPIGD